VKLQVSSKHVAFVGPCSANWGRWFSPAINQTHIANYERPLYIIPPHLGNIPISMPTDMAYCHNYKLFKPKNELPRHSLSGSLQRKWRLSMILKCRCAWP